MSEPPVDYIELNMSNFSDGQVAQLNEWAIWAADVLEHIERENAELRATLDRITASHRQQRMDCER